VLKTQKEWILKRAGEEGLRAVEEEARKLGYPIEYRKIKTIDWYPAGMVTISILVMKKALNLTDEDIFQPSND
jgi:hypothetical protein